MENLIEIFPEDIIYKLTLTKQPIIILYYIECSYHFLYASNVLTDINECLLRNGHGPCQDTCINFWGGYNCSCDRLPGTKLSDNKHGCEDLDECLINNAGCSHTCLNTFGKIFLFFFFFSVHLNSLE